MKKYLIMECRELLDAYECDCDRTPLCLTSDISQWKFQRGFEIYEIMENGSFELIKEHDTVLKDSASQKVWYVDFDEKIFFTKEEAMAHGKALLEGMFEIGGWTDEEKKEAIEEFEKTGEVECIIEVCQM